MLRGKLLLNALQIQYDNVYCSELLVGFGRSLSVSTSLYIAASLAGLIDFGPL